MADIVLKPHQKAVVEQLKTTNGLILYHTTGSGKTITSLVSMYQFKNRIIIIGPKSSRKAFLDEIFRLKLDLERFSFFTFTKIIALLEIEPYFLAESLTIVDEAHGIRNITKHNRELWYGLWKTSKVLLLSATILVNHVCDLFVLLNILNKNRNLPSSKKRYESMKESINFEKEIYGKISYYKAPEENYPEYKKIIKKVFYTSTQTTEYKKYARKILYAHGKVSQEDEEQGSKWIKKYNIPEAIYELDESIQENSFLAATRQIANTMYKSSNYPKIEGVVSTIVADNLFPVVVYSSYLGNGIYPIYKSLLKKNISCSIISGEKSISDIISIVNKYNSGKLQVLLISLAGSESLDLKNTRRLHILEPFWNTSRITQVIGRVVRYKSHITLPKEDRNLIIYEWISIFKENKYKGLSADEYLQRICEYKNKENKFFNDIIISMANYKQIK